MFQEVSSVQGERVLDPSYPQYHELTKQVPSSNYSSQNPSFQPVNSNIQTTCSYYEPIISTPNQPLHSIYQQMSSSIQSVNSSFQTVIPNQEQERFGHQIVSSSYQLENSKFQIENSIMTNPLVEASKQNENIEKVIVILQEITAK